MQPVLNTVVRSPAVIVFIPFLTCFYFGSKQFYCILTILSLIHLGSVEVEWLEH